MNTWRNAITICFATILSMACSKSSDTVPAKNQEVTVYSPVSVSKSNSMKIYAHYMAWFETKESSSNQKWGIHWTMANKNPDNILANGNREIASYYYPSIGPYASGDKDVIEYHLLLMKYSGIDGVIIDWYGATDVNDYAGVRKNTEALISLIEKTGLSFAIDYEDRTLTDVVAQGAAATKVDGAQNDMVYLQNNYFNNANYIKINSSPLLLTFGPIVLQSETEWSQTFDVINTKSCFLTLWNESGDAGKNASGEYAWVWQNNTSLDNFYANRIKNLSVAMGSAYPGFKDFYTAGGWGGATGWTIDAKDGATFDENLQRAKNANIKYLQLVTWNDFGEGTIIEPTKEFGYRYLQKLQTFAGTTLSNSTFEDISNLYALRKKCKGNATAQKSLDQAFYYFVALKHDQAKQTLDSLQTIYK
jgi:hypothetical protein